MRRQFFHALIHECARKGNPKSAMWCAERMERAGLKQDTVTVNSVLNSCASGGRVDLATEWWNRTIATGIVQPSAITYNTMIKVCARGGQALKAEEWAH